MPDAPSPGPPLLEARGLERRFGAARALAGVSLTVAPGECHLLAGPNGAGKTTLLRLLAGLARPSAGVVLLEGRVLTGRDTRLPGWGGGDRRFPLPAAEPGLRRLIGLLSHQSQLYDDLTAGENLEFAARIHGLPDPEGRALRALAAVGLAERARDPVRRLSRGMVQRVAFARALLHEPKVVLLDEPFTGMDPTASESVAVRLAAERKAGRALVLVTHDVLEAWDLASHAHIMVRGAWAVSGPRGPSLDGFLAAYREAVRG
ncbi:MAG TPA: ABC transporter ATP-binding protein [Gemmatimonadales bacterium]|nr:ABC transporter ATP-binding protein [Gemmatimonadales bacterium]